MRKEKKEMKIIDDVSAVAEKFVRICKEKGIPKININIHMYTLWSVGKLNSSDLLKLSMIYVNHKVEPLNFENSVTQKV